MGTKPTTGKYSMKPYECKRCGHKHQVGTNHWGETYGPCPNCQWKYPMEFGSTHVCLEPVPEGYGVPEPWRHARLGDLVEIVPGRKP